MKTKADKIKSSPELSNIADELDSISSISAIADMNGGKILLKNLTKDIISNIETLGAKYKTLTLQEFIGLAADIKTKIDMIGVLKNADKNKEFLTELLEKGLMEVEE